MDGKTLPPIPSAERVAEVFRGGSQGRRERRVKPKRERPGGPVGEEREEIAGEDVGRGKRLDVRA